ncbi:hypothetical protein [Tunicatimonas pelagia]|uniref:hypothetical protein n=1 Tax=Tunicatimonas pelagia TaxID=931531 RepID=UPI002665E480|nr:hypothetical protein [Tunicatimonas pelagia]WKN42129.1 hypothetical protein P0M28_24135 [Tunicatimonas pelagia]
MNEETKIANIVRRESLKEHLIKQLHSTDNPLILEQIKTVLEDQETLDRIIHSPQVQRLVKERENEDYSVQTQLTIQRTNALRRYDAKVASSMFYLAVLSLLLIGALIIAYTEETPSRSLLAWLSWLGGALGFIYFLFVVDVLLLFYKSRQDRVIMNKPEKRRRLLTLLFPPLRIGSRDITEGQYSWMPGWRWCKVNEGLFIELKKRFVLPMIGIAVLIIPVLIIEWKLLDEVQTTFPQLKINLILEAVQTFIWCAFTFEFILMISISRRKMNYVKKNWIDLLIILLPFISFLRTLRISQIARLKYATRSFKLRGVVTKARQGLIFVDFVQRIFRLRPENEVRRLFRLLQENQRDREELQQKLKEVVQLIEKKNKRS